MTKIKILPEILSNKIAAGEVVERPASVVKELVENAIDAGSDKILIEVEAGGKSLIRVSDNGCGMGRDDALLAIERYATSKIATESDLDNIGTLGFRGEALPSIAAVSRFTLVTRQADSDIAAKIFVEGGRIKSVGETGAPLGTMTEVRHLFFNTPGRRKFLKTTTTEIGHIVDVAVHAALARPDIRVRLVHNGRVARDFLPVSDPADRIADVFGPDIRPLLYPVKRPGESISISGWIVDPAMDNGSMNRIFIFVNGRHVKDRGVAYALVDGYAGRLMKGRFPMAVIYIEIPPGQVDVNVHPAKHEVRFVRPKEVHESIRSAVAAAWQSDPAPRDQDAGPRMGEDNSQTEFRTGPVFYGRTRVSEPDVPYDSGRRADMPGFGEKVMHRSKNGQPAKMPRKKPGLEPGQAMQAPIWERTGLLDAVLIGQFKNAYILCEIGDELVFIDQHAAHERILYERLKKKRDAGAIPVQKLLMPETVELGASESALIEEMVGDLATLGLDIEHFGDETFVIKSLPAMIADREIKPLLIEFASELAGDGYTPGLLAVMDKLTILMACHGAIRANQHLLEKEMRALISQLAECDNPFNCPHGRPTTTRWPLRTLEKAFKRIV
ncbi:MAG: DNA mismatch repair endonuclease MutL [Deltaproteobacteria bacterium]|nr:DNA mismatch repair endonuclease MutL [Deltaproteobacteria bacterium]